MNYWYNYSILASQVSIVVLDIHKMEKELTKEFYSTFWDKKYRDDINQWAKEKRYSLVIFGNSDTNAQPYSCLYFAPRMDGTQSFIGWLIKKYGEPVAPVVADMDTPQERARKEMNAQLERRLALKKGTLK